MYVLVHVCRAHLPGAWFVFDPVLEIRPIIRLPKQDELGRVTCNASTHTQKLRHVHWDRSCDNPDPSPTWSSAAPRRPHSVRCSTEMGTRHKRAACVVSCERGVWVRTWYGRLHQDHEEGLTCDSILTTSSVEADLLTSACFLQISLLISAQY